MKKSKGYQVRGFVFPVVLYKGRMNKIQARSVADPNICIMKDNARMAYLVARHELYHFAKQPDFQYSKHKVDSIFDVAHDPQEVVCMIDVNFSQYAKKAKRFARKSSWLSKLTFHRRQCCDLIALYKKQFIYPVVVKKRSEGIEIRFIDFPHLILSHKTESQAFSLARQALYHEMMFWVQQKKEPIPASDVFSIQCEEDELRSLIDVDIKEYRKERIYFARHLKKKNHIVLRSKTKSKKRKWM